MEHYIGPNGELYHAAKKSGWEKEDHKYIKREWKNGKWVYTYPSDAKKSQPLKKNIAGAKIRREAADLVTTGRTKAQSAFNKAAVERAKSNKSSSKPYVSKEYQEELAYNSQKNRYPANKPSTEPKAEASVKTAGHSGEKNSWLNKAKTTIGTALDKVVESGKKFIGIAQKEDWEKSAVNYADATQKVNEKVDIFYTLMGETDWGNQDSVDAWNRAADDARAAFDAEERAMNAYFNARDAYEKTPMGAIDKAAYFAEKDIKDKLGYDERDIRDAAVKARESIIREQKLARQLAENLRSGKIVDDTGRTKLDLPDKIADWYDGGPDLLGNYVKGTLLYAEQEVERAQKAYLSTPLGRLEKLGDDIDSGKKWLDERLDDLEDWFDDLRR